MKISKFILSAGIAALMLGSLSPAFLPEAFAAQEAKAEAYQCPMHPQIVSDRPGKCPICGMALVKVQAGPAPASHDSEHAVPSHAAVTLTPEARRQIGAQTAKAEMRELTVPLRVTARAAYEPDLYNLIAEYRQALALHRKLRGSSNMQLREQAEDAMKLAELKMRISGIGDEQVENLVHTGPSYSSLVLSGPSKALYLPEGSVWVYADLSEMDAELVKAGDKVGVTAPALPSESFEGEVYSVDALIGGKTRMVRARIQVAKAEGRLKPGMTADAVLNASIGRSLAVPQEALFDTGSLQYVFVEKEGGVFEPRRVRAGRKAGDYRQIMEGLTEGEAVLVSANFLVDSESRLKAAQMPEGHRHG